MKLKLTKAGRVVVFLVVIALVISAGYFAVTKFNNLFDVKDVDLFNKTDNEVGISGTTDAASDNVIDLSLDEWIGWKPIIDANGGLTTQSGSIYDDLGIKVNINIINDAEASSNAMIKGDLDACGYTINRMAFLSNKFTEAKTDVVMPVFTNYSNGGDGIIALSNINSIEDLVNAKIGVPKFSEAQTLVVWLVEKSDLSETDKEKIINNLILLDDAEQTGQAFFAGSLDVAATWQPYLSNAENSTNSHILFDTTSSNKLILDGIVFRADFANNNSELVSKFIDGMFKAKDMYDTEFDAIRKVMPMFANSSDEEIKDMCGDAGIMGYAENVNALDTDCHTVYLDMCDVWERVGEKTNRDIVTSLFDNKYVKALDSEYSSITEVKKFEITDEQKVSVKEIEALLTKSATVNFVPDTAKFIDTAEADATLKEFVEIAKTLDGTIIQIEGNINAVNCTESGMKLSEERAKTVMNYFIMNGIDANRIIIVGNGNTKMVVDPNSADATANRRTDVFFKTIEN